MSGEWSSPICGCFNDCSICLLAFCCPCILIGNNADVVGENKTLCCLLSCVTLWFAPTFLCYVGYLVIRMMLRGKIRQQKNIDGSALGDLCCAIFCDPCSLAQEGIEVSSPGAMYIVRE